jgi:hypothetical protein
VALGQLDLQLLEPHQLVLLVAPFHRPLEVLVERLPELERLLELRLSVQQKLVVLVRYSLNR